MSNPFLVDLDESYTPYASGMNTPFSGMYYTFQDKIIIKYI